MRMMHQSLDWFSFTYSTVLTLPQAEAEGFQAYAGLWSLPALAFYFCAVFAALRSFLLAIHRSKKDESSLLNDHHTREVQHEDLTPSSLPLPTDTGLAAAKDSTTTRRSRKVPKVRPTFKLHCLHT